jgi:hypothetical protein
MSETVTPLTYKLSLLHLVEETSHFAGTMDLLSGWHGTDFAQKSGFLALYEASRESISDGLKQIGGLKATIDATDDTPVFEVLLTDWGGRDPDDPSKHLWIGVPLQNNTENRHALRGSNGHLIGIQLGPEAIAEIREKLLTDIEF